MILSSRRIRRMLRSFLACLVILTAISGNIPFPSIGLNIQSAHALDNGIALTPPMGWNSWNKYGCRINEDLIKSMADALITSGMKEAGYTYVNIDDCWEAPERDANGDLQAHPVTFPGGIQALADYVHSKGLKLGIYSSNGALTCRGRPASFGHEEQDARKFAEWGVDLVKYDWCYHPLNYTGDIDHIRVDGVTYEAEAAARSGTAVLTNCTGCSGGKKVSHIGNNAGALTFTDVTVPADGTYDVQVNYTIDRKFIGDFANSWNEHTTRLGMIGVNGEAGVQYAFPDPVGMQYKNTGVNESDWYLQPTNPNKVGTITARVALRAGANTIKFDNPMSRIEFTQYAYTRMRDAIQNAGRPMIFSICEWGENEPWTWGEEVGHMWRTSSDIGDNWSSITAIIDGQVGRERYAGPGHWNDPDMLEVGNGGMTDTEYRSHFSLWSMLASPLITGNDLTNMSQATKDILLHTEVIAVNQDALGVQASRIRDDGDQEVWVKPLANGDRAVVLFNRGLESKTIQIQAQEIGLPQGQSYRIRDLWNRTEAISASGAISSSVASHGVSMYRVNVFDGDLSETLPAARLAVTAPSYIFPGKSFEVTTTFLNDGPNAMSNANISLQAPGGWAVEAVTAAAVQQVGSGQSVETAWRVTPSEEAATGNYKLTGRAAYTYGALTGSALSDAVVINPPILPSGEAYLSDVAMLHATNGWGPVERNMSNGEKSANDGKPIRLGGIVYPKGLGVHANSIVSYYLNGRGKSFTSDIGVDDEVWQNGSVIFQVWADGSQMYDSGTMTGSSATQSVSLDMTGVYVLRLVVSDSGDGNGLDHADWAGAKITSLEQVEPPVIQGPKATLSGAGSVPAGSEFRIRYGLQGVTQSVYGQDVTLQYDPSSIEFVSAQTLKEGISIVNAKNNDGTLRLIIASQGANHAVTGTAEIADIVFKAKIVQQAATGVIAVTYGELGDGNGGEMQVSGSSVSVQITPVPVGISGDVNNDLKVTIGDLAMVAAAYGKSAAGPDWAMVVRADINHDQKVDILDLAAVSIKILD